MAEYSAAERRGAKEQRSRGAKGRRSRGAEGRGRGGGGHATAPTQAFLKQQQALMGEGDANSSVEITTGEDTTFEFHAHIHKREG